jgi:hypothetical protein
MPLARGNRRWAAPQLLSRLLGFVRIAIAAALGAGPLSDAFFAVLQIELLRRLLARARQCRLRADVAADPGARARARRQISAGRLAAMLLAVGTLAAIGLSSPLGDRSAGAGFDGERQARPRTISASPPLWRLPAWSRCWRRRSMRGRVVAAALAMVRSMRCCCWRWRGFHHGAPAPSTTGVLLSYAIVLARLTQLLVTGIGFLRLRHRLPRPQLAFSADARFFALAGRPDRRRHSAAEADRRRDDRLVGAGSVVAYYANRLYELPLGIVSIASRRCWYAAIGGLQRGRRGNGGSTVARPGDRTRPGAAGRRQLCGAGGADRKRPVRAQCLRAARYHGFVAAALAAICAGLPGRAGEGLRRHFLCAKTLARRCWPR